MIPSGNLRMSTTWEDFFETRSSGAGLKRSSSQGPTMRRKREPALDSLATSMSSDDFGFSTTASTAASQSRKAVTPGAASSATWERLSSRPHRADKVVRPDTTPARDATASLTQRSGMESSRLKPHSARPREVYDGPPGPGSYIPDLLDTKDTLLSTFRSMADSSFGGKLASVNRSLTGPFGPALRSGSKPGPCDYSPVDHRKRGGGGGSTSSSSFGFASRSTIADKQVDPERKLAPSGELSPGPGAYLSDSLPIPPLTVTLTGSDASKPRVKYPLSTTRNPPLASMSHTEPRFETGPFGRYEMGKAGVDNPGPQYALPSTLQVKGPAEAKPGASLTMTLGRSNPLASLGGTSGRSHPMCRTELFNPHWQPVTRFDKDYESKKAIGPGSYNSFGSTLGKQALSGKRTEATVRFATEKRDVRYKYQQPGFTSGTDKTFDMPGPAAYNVREVELHRGKALPFGTSGRSPVGIVYS